MELPYDEYNVDSIVEYAQRLVGHSLREMTDLASIQDPKRRRGAYGNAIEECYFRIPANSRPEADFAKAGLELKVTPLKQPKPGVFRSKERLVLANIDYHAVVSETFETSHLLEKIRRVLLIEYLWEKDVDPLDYQVLLADVWSIPEEDLPQMRQDWETVVQKVRDGHAEDISGRDTLYLEACTKAADSSVRRSQPYSDVPAKPRAWALKASYMTAISNGLLSRQRARLSAIPKAAAEREISLIDLVRSRFEPYMGQTQAELARKLGCNPRAKSVTALITKRILGVSPDEQIEEFAKAGIKAKTLRIRRNGTPKESMSFPAFDYFRVAEEPFEDSDFYEQVSAPYLFVIFHEDPTGEYRLGDVRLWQMPEEDIEAARRCYEQMRANIQNGHAELSVKASENPVAHVRPHARNAADVRPQPYGPPVVKKCFWINSRYLARQIEQMER